MKKPLPKLFVIRKYIWAQSAQDALRKEKDSRPDECWLDEQWRANSLKSADAIGFRTKDD